jgi:hypothetical protein
LRAGSNTIHNQLQMIETRYRAFTTEVQERENDIRQVRNQLLQEVDTTLTESAAQFKQGRAAMVKALAEYETASQKLSNRIGIMTDIAAELATGATGVHPANILTKKWEPGTQVTIHAAPMFTPSNNQHFYHGPINTSPMGTHYTSPLGTVRPIGQVRGVFG